MTKNKIFEMLDNKHKEFITNGFVPDFWILEFNKKDFGTLNRGIKFIKEPNPKLKDKVNAFLDSFESEKLKLPPPKFCILTKRSISYLIYYVN